MLSDAAFNLSAPFGLPIVAPPPDELIEPGEVIEIGPSRWEVLDTSGHTPGGVSFYCAAAGVVIVGDALFAGSIGRCDIPGASEQRLLRNIREKLLSLPEATRVLPGHREETTIGREKRTNPYLSP
jgi:glyoxylase-like metal-dependent hydrolase (beta-lactamase superfamily II)